MKRIISDEEFIHIVQDSLSIAEVIRKCGKVPAGGNYAVVHGRIESLGIDTSHFTGQGWNTGNRYRKAFQPKPLTEILKRGVRYQSYKLARRLIAEAVKDRKCENCGLKEWLGKQIPLELHHINGDSTDNRIENLALLCPNCHAQTDNYRGKNKGRMVELLDTADLSSAAH